MQTQLKALIHPLTTEDFFQHYKKNEPFIVHHDLSSLGLLNDLPFLKSLDSLLEFWTNTVQVHLLDLRDEASAIDVPAGEARNYFDQGMALLFNDANRFSDILEEWVQKVRIDLGFSNLTYSRNLIYVTPDGKGTAPHFDQNINFVLQISGTKRWTLAANSSVTHPMVRHTMGQPVDPEMMNYLEAPMPMSMPNETVTFDLKPGSLLFVPRGVWHETSAEGDAISLNFTFTAPTWADLLLSALRSRLVLSPEWRETADGSAENFDELLAGLIQELPQWRAEDILSATEDT